MFEPDTEPEFDTFTDLLFNSCVGFAFFFFLAFALINPTAKTGEIDTDVEVLITVGWPDSNPDDVDVYVQDPAGNIVWYNDRERGLMHLERDDRGLFKDVVMMNGEEVTNPLNQEIVSLRGLVDGEYIVNIVHYVSTEGQPLPVTVKVEKINPALKVVYYGETILKGTGDERTAVRFTLRGNDVEAVNNMQKSLVALTKGLGPSDAPTLNSRGEGVK